MPQVFRPNANGIARLVLALTIVGVVGAGIAGHLAVRSDFVAGTHFALNQPVPFSHEHHVAGLGIDCRYCHNSVETSAFAGMPSSDVCMTCHSELWTQAEMLAPVRQSLATGTPIRWHRVNDIADFAYFNHAIHISNGVACVTCHGPVDRMPITWKEHTLYMQWCLDCHRNPAPNLRPREAVFDTDWKPPEDAESLGKRLMAEYDIDPERMTDCYVCHR